MPEPSGRPPAPEPATVEQLRSLRRWLLVAGVWATAATAIAVIALLAANRDDDEEQDARTASQIGQLQRRMSERIDALEGRVDELPRSEDVDDLDARLRAVEDGAGRTSDRIGRIGGRIDELEAQVEALEQAGPGTDTTGTTTTP